MIIYIFQVQMYYLNVNPICTEESNINKEHLISFYSGSGSAAIQLIDSSSFNSTEQGTSKTVPSGFSS